MATGTTSTANPSTKSKVVTPTVDPAAVTRQPAAESSDGKRMFRRVTGELVELPPDVSIFEAVKMELEALAAEKKLGKRPPPKPVPNKKKEAKKEKKTKVPDKKAKKKGDKGKGKEKKGGKAAGKGGFLAKTKVALFLMAKGAPAILKGIANLARLNSNEKTHDDAGTKLKQTEESVVPPAEEGQSKSNTAQVETVEGKPAPKPDENVAKNKLKESLEENIPETIEDVDNFKKNKKAQHMSADVMGVVSADKNSVTSTFNEIEQAPPPAPPSHTPVPLPGEEVAPPTPQMNLGAGAVASLQKEHTDVSNYTKEADGKLKEEGVTQEQLDMVDSGDLAEANKEKKGMEKKAKTEPVAIQTFAKNESNKVDQDLKKEEKSERDKLKQQRKQALGNTKQKQQGAKSELEKKREEVTNKINTIYKTAQDSVKKKLADLETVALKRFDEGNAAASKAFEDNVKRELDAFKDDRYSGFFGWARRAKDWLLGMDDLPQVKAIFDRNRTAFVNAVEKLVNDITADNKRVIQECKDELANAKKQIKEYVDKLGPELKDVGKKAQEDMNSKLEELDKFINKKEEELQQKLKDKQQAAIKAIDEKIEKMKEEMSGALSKLGKLLLLAAKKFFTWALEKFGFSLAEIEDIINKGAAVLKAIFTQPIKFVKNLMNAAITGFKNFGKNFVKHLRNALFEWLTGAMEGVEFPDTWDLKGIVKFALSILGVSYANLRKHMVTLVGEKPIAMLEGTFSLVKTLVLEGPVAAWEQLKEMAEDMKNALMEAVIDFVKMKVIEEAIKWLVGIFVPGAGIIKAIIGIYDTIVFFIQKAKQIMQLISTFLGSIAQIAAGNIGAAADAMENGLARGLSLAISFLAQLLHMNAITDKIKAAIQKIRSKVDGVMAKVAKWVVDKGKKLISAFTGKKEPVKPGEGSGTEGDEPDEETDKILAAVSIPFKMKSEDHNAWLEKKNGKWEIFMASEVPGILYKKILSAEVEIKENIDKGVPPIVRGATWESLLGALDKRKGDVVVIYNLFQRIEKKDPARKELAARIPGLLNKVIGQLKKLGETHGIHSLINISTLKHNSKFVAGDTIDLTHPKLGNRQKMREVFYGGFDSTTLSWRDTRRDAVFNPINPANGREDPAKKLNFISEASYSDEQRWNAKTIIGGSIFATVPKSDLSLDHHPESVAEHWNNKGRYTDQSTREKWYNDTTNLRMISGKLNSSLGSAEPKKELQVGPKFMGPLKPGYEM